MAFNRHHSVGPTIRRFITDILLSVLGFSTVVLLPLLPAMGFARLVRMDHFWTLVGIYVFSAIVGLSLSKTHRMIWRYVSFKDLLSLIQAATITIGIFLVAELTMFGPAVWNSIVLLICTVILVWTANIAFLSAPRVIARVLAVPHAFPHQPSTASTSVLVTGDVQRVESFVRECHRDTSSRYWVVGILLDDRALHGSYLDGIEVLGAVSNIKSIMVGLKQRLPVELHPTTLAVAKDDATRSDYERLLRITTQTGLKIGRLPRHGVLQQNVTTPVEPIELSDLLGRPEVTSDAAAVSHMIEGMRVLVTGAGGSIGSELVRQIARFRPAKLMVLDFSEYNLYTIDRELSETNPDLERQTLLADVRDGNLISQKIKETAPDIVFHAAALKHVPLVEDHPVEAIKTNVIGTINVAEACCAFGVRAMVTISTDKAVNPCNVMGATKRLAEAYCQGLDQSNDRLSKTRFITVRFGNVLGSAGSVVPLFQRQIEAGGPITVTHEEIKRYFMTIPEASTLVLQAGAQSIEMDAERGSIYVLDMGEPVRIVDLARQMIRLSGQLPDIDIKIEIIGLRPGEKLYEEVAHSEELALPTRSNSILRLKPRTADLRILRQQVQEMRHAFSTGDTERAMRVLRLSVPEYSDASSEPSPTAHASRVPDG